METKPLFKIIIGMITETIHQMLDEIAWKSLVWTNKALPHWTTFHIPGAHVDITVWLSQSFPLSSRGNLKAISETTTYHSEQKIKEIFYQLLKASLRHRYLVTMIWSNCYHKIVSILVFMGPDPHRT